MTPGRAPRGAGARVPLALVPLALGAASAEAQTVAGIVRDARTRGVVENASVALRDAADRDVASARSDSLGVFYLTAPAPGTYTLRFSLGAGPERTTPPIELATIESFHQSTFVVEVPIDPHFFEFQVEQPVTPLDNLAPTYPRRLQEEGVGGRVVAQFVVDTTGRAEVGSLKAIEFTHREFVDAVREALPRMRYAPAQIGDRRVRQLVQQAFDFKMGRAMPSLHRRRGSDWPPLPPIPGTRPPE